MTRLEEVILKWSERAAMRILVEAALDGDPEAIEDVRVFAKEAGGLEGIELHEFATKCAAKPKDTIQ